MKCLHIYEDEEHTLIETTKEVLKLLESGCTRGINPNFDIGEVQDE